MGMLKGIMHALQTNYPERLGRMWMINAPWLFSGLWRVIKKMLDKKTTDKVIFGFPS